MGKAVNPVQSSANQSSPSQAESTNPVFDRLFNNLTLSEKAAFDRAQVEILKQACVKLNPRKHPIDIRISIPWPGKRGLYLVLLAGDEQRSLHRIRSQRATAWMAASLVAGVGTLLGLTYVGVRAIAFQLTVAEMYAPHPTSLPWINSKQACREQGRIWDDGQCWDANHSPEF